MAFDTAFLRTTAEAGGMPEAQAEAVAETTRGAITADAATKADIECFHDLLARHSVKPEHDTNCGDHFYASRD